MRTIGVGLLGVGWMGRLHTTAYRRVADHYPDLAARPRFVAAADEVADRAAVATGALGYERFTTDWRDVVADPDVDVVSITAPNALHREMATAAAAAGKPFWGEKPLGREPAETAAIAAAAEAAGIVTTVGFNYRHAPAVVHARELIAAGELGEVTSVRATFLADYASSPSGGLTWRFTRVLGGLGVLGDLMSHAVDLVQYLLGPITTVSAEGATFIAQRPVIPMGATHFSVVEDGEPAPVENEDYTAALVRFAGGARGTLEASRVAIGPHARYTVEVHGSRGALSWNFERLNELQLSLPGGPLGNGYATVYAGPGHGDFARFQPSRGISMGYDDLKVIEAQHFLASVADGRQREPGVAQARAMAEVLAAMQRSFTSGAWEPVRPVDEGS